MTRLVRRGLTRGLLFAGLLLSSSALAVGTQRLALRSADDFEAGKLEGVSIDSAGTIRAGLHLADVPVAEADLVWDALALPNGTTLLATGNEGKLLEYSGGAIKELAKADAMSLTSVTQAWGGAVVVGTLPGAAVLRYAAGKLSPVVKLGEDEHVLAMAFDAQSQALFVATGPHGKLYRVGQDGKAQVYFDAVEEHIMSVAVGKGVVYAGTADKAKLYEITGPGRARVIHDFNRTEVRAIRVSANGDVFAIANEVKPHKFPTTASASSAKSKSSAATKTGSSTSSGSGVLYRFSAAGDAEELFSDSSHAFASLALDARGRPYVGTGSDGQLYTVMPNRNSVLVADTEERQLSALLLTGKNQLLIGSDPVVVHPVSEAKGQQAVWTSQAVDLGLPSRFGRLDWIGEGAIELSTRTGNTSEPDANWSEWSKAMRSTSGVASPKGRYFQVRASFLDSHAALDEVTLAYVTDNLRATIAEITVETPGQAAQHGPDGKIRASGGPQSTSVQHEVDLEWRVDNPDKDVLRFRLAYQLLGSETWIDMLRPQERLTKTSYTWDTSSLPEGRYRVRVAASDELSNPPGSVETYALVSNTLVVDNTAPRFEKLTVANGRLSGAVVDGMGPVARIEVSIAGTDEWLPLSPTDGIFDEAREEFSVELSALGFVGPGMVAVRAFDQENNQVVESLLHK